MKKLGVLLGTLLLMMGCNQEQVTKLEISNLNRSNIYYLDQTYDFKGDSSEEIKEVVVSFKGEEIERVIPSDSKFSFSMTFHELEKEVLLTVSGLDGEGKELAASSYKFNVVERVTGGGDMFDFSLPNPESGEIGSSQNLWATNYYLVQVRSIEDGFALRDMNGNELGPKLARRDWCDSAMEGSVLVLDDNGEGVTYNYAGTSSSHKVDCSMYWSYNSSTTKFKKANGKYGDGVRGYKLVPFRTVAVDRKRFPYGTVLYIPAAVGNKLILPDGSIAYHDGYFFAGDTGSAIKTNHIDVYTGVAEKKPFDWVKSSSKKTFKAHVVKNPAIKKYLEDLHLN